jgi:hypothetical protein
LLCIGTLPFYFGKPLTAKSKKPQIDPSPQSSPFTKGEAEILTRAAHEFANARESRIIENENV